MKKLLLHPISPLLVPTPPWWLISISTVGCSDVEPEALLEAELDASEAAMDGETEGGGGKGRTMLVLQQRTISSTNKTLVYMQTSLISPWKRRWKQERSSPHSISVSLQIFTSLWNHTSIFLALKAAVKERERECESADKDSFLIFLHCLTAQKVCFYGCVPSSVSSNLLFCQVTKGGRTCPEVLSCALSL